MSYIIDNAARHEPTAFKKGKSMSEQLREERAMIENSAKIQPRRYSKKNHPGILNHMANVEMHAFVKEHLKKRVFGWSMLVKLANAKGLRTMHGYEWKRSNMQTCFYRIERALL